MKHDLVFCVKFIAAALVTFICFEIHFPTTEISLPSFVYDDPVIGRAFRPRARTALIQEELHMGQVNEYGCLGPAYPPERTEGTLRVALVGDSFLEAFQVLPKWNSRSVLESELSKSAGRRVEMLNFGLNGDNLRTMYAHDKDLVTRFKPDITVFVITADPFFGRDYSMGPVCYLNENGDLKVDYDFARSETFRRKIRLGFARQFGSYQSLQSAWARYKRGETPQIVFDKFAPRRRVKSEESPANLWEARHFKLDKAVIAGFGRLRRSGHSRIIIVGHRGVPSHYRSAIEEAGLTCIDLEPELEALRRADTDPYYWPVICSQGYSNHEGQRFIGEYLGRRLLELERTQPSAQIPRFQTTMDSGS